MDSGCLLQQALSSRPLHALSCAAVSDKRPAPPTVCPATAVRRHGAHLSRKPSKEVGGPRSVQGGIIVGSAGVDAPGSGFLSLIDKAARQDRSSRVAVRIQNAHNCDPLRECFQGSSLALSRE